MRIEFLGTAASFGVPQIGCPCAVCASPDPRDRRYRCALWVQTPRLSLLVDTPPDLRSQCLRAGLTRLDALLYTHLHADHVFGLDDVRIFTQRQGRELPVYLPTREVAHFTRTFAYALHPPPPGLTRPRLHMEPQDGTPFTLADLAIEPLEVWHGEAFISSYIFRAGRQRVAYLTDCKELPAAGLAAVRGVDVLILGALWNEPISHPNHLNLSEALALAAEIGPRQTYLTHLTHRIGFHAAAAAILPPNVALAYDGLVLDVD